MLDYSTIQVVDQCMDKEQLLTPSIAIGIIVVIALLLCLGAATDNFLWFYILAMLLAAVVVIPLAYGEATMSPYSLVKIETTGVEMKTDVYPSENEIEYLKKEGDKIYFYTQIFYKPTDNLHKIKMQTKDGFERVIFNLENEEK